MVPLRTVHCGDALPWLRAGGVRTGAAMVTSLPDISELGRSESDWRAWFTEALACVVRATPPTSVALFFQSDVRHEDRWIDKGALVVAAGAAVGAHVVFHRIVCRFEPGRAVRGRPTYTHLIALSRALRSRAGDGMPDVITEPGRAVWPRAMGIKAAAQAVRFARDEAGVHTIIDPFCGAGTVLAVANALGLHAEGVDLSARCCTRARALSIEPGELDDSAAFNAPARDAGSCRRTAGDPR
jgi:hypothetical protein